MRGSVAIFGMIVSAAVSAAGTYILVKKLYDDRVTKDISEAKEYYRKHYEEKKEKSGPMEEAEKTPVKETVQPREPEVIIDTGTDEEEESDETEEDDEDEPPLSNMSDEEDGRYFLHSGGGIRLVTEQELAASPYGHVFYTYFADGFLVDDFDDILDEDETEESIGSTALSELGEMGEKRVFVLNDTLRLAVEVVFDERRAMDIPKYAHRYEKK